MRNLFCLGLRPFALAAGFLVLQFLVLPIQAQQQALFVYAGAPMNVSDQAISNRLVTLGYTVTAVLDTASATSQATGKDIVYVSATVGSGNVAAKFRDTGVPVIADENAIFDDMLWTLNNSPPDRGTIANQQNANIVEPTHPLAAGLSGTNQLVSVNRTFVYGLPNEQAYVIARSTDGNNRPILFGYDKGATLINGTSNALARGVGIFLDNDTAQSLTNSGFALFDAAVAWVTDKTSPAGIARAPTNTTGIEGLTATFSVISTGAPTLFFQWQRSDGSGGFTNIPSANSRIFTTPVLRTNDDGASFVVVVSNVFNTATSSPPAVLTITPDTNAPTLLSAATRGNPNGVNLSFSEPVSEATATNVANYSITNSAGATWTVTNAYFFGDTRTVVLATSEVITNGGVYTVTVTGVQDRAAAPNTISPNPSSAGFLQLDGVITRKVFTGLSTSVNTMDQLTNNVKFINDTPDLVTYPTLFEGPVNFADGYGTRFQGYVIPSITGDYVFFICSDDPSELYLSTDENPANSHLIGRETGWSNTRQWVSSPGGSVVASKRSDQYTGSTWPGGTNITLTAGTRYYIEARHKEGGGGDNIAATWRVPGGAAIVDGAPPISGANLSSFGATPGPVLITSQPTNQTVDEPQTATFSVSVQGSPPFTQQWQRSDGAGGFTNIPVANALTFTTPPTVPANSGAMYRAVVSNAFSVATSAAATLAVIADTNPPTLLSVGSLDGKAIGVAFDEPMAAASAQNVANYTITSGGPITNATLRAGARLVVLSLAGTANSSFSVTATGVQDASVAGNPGGGTVGGTIESNLISAALAIAGTTNDPALPGSGIAFGNSTYEIVAGGSDIWGNQDHGHWIYRPATGDFDLRVRVDSLTRPDAITKADLMVRDFPSAGARNLHTSVNPPLALGGRDQYEPGQRTATNGATAGWGSSFVPAGIPNAWMRITRVANTFTNYRSSDGINWIAMGNTTQTYPATVLVGMAATAHNNAAPVTSAVFKNFAVINLPMARNDTLGAVSGSPTAVLIEKLLANDSHPTGLTFSLTAVSATSTNGGTVSMTTSNVTYTSVAGFVGTDRFTYTITDSAGISATATVVVTVTASDAQSRNLVLVAVNPANNHAVLTFAGIPGRNYQIQYADSLTPPVSWTNIGAVQTAGANGLFTFEDPTDPPPAQRFYRTVAQ